MKKIYVSKIDRSVLEAVAELEKLGFTPYMLSVAKYNLRMLEGKVQDVKSIVSKFTYPYIRRIAGRMGASPWKIIRNGWNRRIEDLAAALRRLAQLNQTKVYLFWKNPMYALS